MKATIRFVSFVSLCFSCLLSSTSIGAAKIENLVPRFDCDEAFVEVVQDINGNDALSLGFTGFIVSQGTQPPTLTCVVEFDLVLAQDQKIDFIGFAVDGHYVLQDDVAVRLTLSQRFDIGPSHRSTLYKYTSGGDAWAGMIQGHSLLTEAQQMSEQWRQCGARIPVQASVIIEAITGETSWPTSLLLTEGASYTGFMQTSSCDAGIATALLLPRQYRQGRPTP